MAKQFKSAIPILFVTKTAFAVYITTGRCEFPYSDRDYIFNL